MLRYMCACMVVIAAAFPTQNVLAEEIDYYYSYYKQKIPLIVVPDTVAIMNRGENQANVSLLLDRAGFPGSETRAMPTAGWTIGLLRAASATPNITDIAWPIAKLIERNPSDRSFFSPVFADDAGHPLFIRPDILVRFRSDVGHGAIQGILGRAGVAGMPKASFGGMEGAYRLHTNFRSGLEVLKVANELATDPRVVFAEPDVLVTGFSPAVPNDPLFGDSWHLENTGQHSSATDIDIDALEAWESTVGHESVIVVILDVGVQQDHPDINQIPGNDFTFEDPPGFRDGGPKNECDNHGTPVAGTVTATVNNDLGVVGVAPGARVASARIGVSNLPCDNTFLYSPSAIVSALDWAEGIGARVTNSGYLIGSSSSSVNEKHRETRDNGIIHFGSAGNSGLPSVPYPSRYESVIAVSAVSPQGQLASFSNFGEFIAFSAPGELIETTDRTGVAGWRPDSDYVTVSGTSFSAPIAAGIAALIISLNSELTPLDVETIMRNTAVDLGVPGLDPFFGWGLVNAGQAVTSISVVFRDGFESGDTTSW